MNLALSPGLSKLSLCGRQEGAKNPPALYPSDPSMTNQTFPKANEPTATNADEVSNREVSSANNKYEALEPYKGPNEWTTVNRKKGKQSKRNEKKKTTN